MLGEQIVRFFAVLAVMLAAGKIFTSIGLMSGVFSSDLYSAVLIMVIGTTLVAPPLLGWALRRGGSTPDAA